MSLTLAFAAAMILSGQDGPIITARAAPTESAESVREREARAYAYPLPPNAPTDDYSFLAYCDGLISGHIQLGETLGANADEELMRLGRLEQRDFASARVAGQARMSAAETASATAAYEAAMTRWQPYLTNGDADARQEAFDLFFGLPGRCEHAARRIRGGITTPPATLEQVGLTREEVLPESLIEAEREAAAEAAAAAAEEAALAAEAAADAAGDESPAATTSDD